MTILRLLNLQGIAGIAVSLCLAILLVLQKGETRHWAKQSIQHEQLYRQEQAAYAGTIANYRAAADAARASDQANAERVAVEQRAINQRSANDFEARLAAARARAEQLRVQAAAAAADPRTSRAAPMPGLPAAARSAAQGAEQNGLSDSDALTATEQAIQLDELINWVKAQAAVDANGAAARRTDLPRGRVALNAGALRLAGAAMKTDRLMAFTDAVLAIAMTIMVLDLRVPDSSDWQAVRPAMPLLATYALAYVNIGIYWTNHHHMLATATRVNGRALWANLFMLFWLTLMPFVIRWMSVAGITAAPVSAYGFVCILAAFGYIWLERELILAEGTESRIRAVVGSRRKEWISFAFYGAGVLAAVISPWIAIALYVGVSSTWLIPDRRFERWHNLQQSNAHPTSN